MTLYWKVRRQAGGQSRENGDWPSLGSRSGFLGVSNIGVVAGPDVGAVPEPTTWAMMLLGFFFIGGTMRSAKRRQKVTVSYA